MATGKIRIKERLTFMDYGQPVAPTQTILTQKHYIEWQIGYDKITENQEREHFIGANGKKKRIYELSKILECALSKKLILQGDLQTLRGKIFQNSTFIDETERITRAHFVRKTINGVDFLSSSVSYPLLVCELGSKDFLCEIIVREKQRAVGVMPMLYLCIPMSRIADKNGDFSFLGRKIQSKETGFLRLDERNIDVFLDIFKIFGLLSRAHQHDCLEILDYLINQADKNPSWECESLRS